MVVCVFGVAFSFSLFSLFNFILVFVSSVKILKSDIKFNIYTKKLYFDNFGSVPIHH